MTKFIIAVWLMCLTLGVKAQQTEELTITKVKKGEEPKAVMDAIKQDFPNSVTKQLSFLPAKLYGQEWNVQLEGENLENVDFYEVSIKEGKNDYLAVYDENGTLLSSRELIHDAALPKEVGETLKKFKDWHVDKSHEMIKYRGGKSSDIFRVKLQKGAEHKIVYLDANGNIINTRFTII